MIFVMRAATITAAGIVNIQENYTLIWFKMDFHLYVFFHFRQLKNLDLDAEGWNKKK